MRLQSNVYYGGRLVPLITKKKRPSLLHNNKWTASSEDFPVTFLASWRSQQSRARQQYPYSRRIRPDGFMASSYSTSSIRTK
ncbi:hypothetical protein TNCV_3927581 [Trichonephila clavipes]|nr:hypothetical protein TNCV_3927581 [Trichonephila clavipes]